MRAGATPGTSRRSGCAAASGRRRRIPAAMPMSVPARSTRRTCCVLPSIVSGGRSSRIAAACCCSSSSTASRRSRRRSSTRPAGRSAPTGPSATRLRRYISRSTCPRTRRPSTDWCSGCRVDGCSTCGLSALTMIPAGTAVRGCAGGSSASARTRRASGARSVVGSQSVGSGARTG